MIKPFWKLEGTGNNFIFFDGWVDESIVPEFLTPQRISELCDRNFGIGADGVIVLSRSNRAKIWMRYWNSDGSVAGMCGNGIRCTTHFARMRGYHDDQPITIELPKQDDVVTVVPVGDSNYQVMMPKATFLPHQIPMVGDGNSEITLRAKDVSFSGIGVGIGNPHFVIPVTSATRELAETYGPILEIAREFPQKTNVEFVEKIADDEIKVWVWERGCGITLSCGSGSCASVAALVKAGELPADRPVNVALPGGDLLVEVSRSMEVKMTGPARFVFSGEIDL